MSDSTETYDPQYLNLLVFLFERYVRPRAAGLRDRYYHHMRDEWSHRLSRTIRATRMLRFIETHFDTSDAVSDTFTLKAMRRTFYDIHFGVALAERIIVEGGYLDAYDADANAILAGMRARYLPEIDSVVLREIGSTDANMELQLLVQSAKAALQSIGQDFSEKAVTQQLKQAYIRTEDAAQEIDKIMEATESEKPREAPKKPRRWYKGLGQIGQGAALTIANAGLALGAIHIPVSPETQTWGALVSVVTGAGTILNGVGDLRNE